MRLTAELLPFSLRWRVTGLALWSGGTDPSPLQVRRAVVAAGQPGSEAAREERTAELRVVREAGAAQAAWHVVEARDNRCTTLVVAHRLSTVSRCDRIVELVDGEMKSYSSVEELQSSSDSFDKLLKLEDQAIRMAGG